MADVIECNSTKFRRHGEKLQCALSKSAMKQTLPSLCRHTVNRVDSPTKCRNVGKSYSTAMVCHRMPRAAGTQSVVDCLAANNKSSFESQLGIKSMQHGLRQDQATTHQKQRSRSCSSCRAPTACNDNNAVGKKLPGRCSVHTDMKLELFCLDCLTNICVSCFVENHNAHRCSDVTEVAKQFQHQMLNHVNSVSNGMHRCLTALSMLSQGQHNAMKLVAKTKCNVMDRAAKLREKIKTDKEKLLSQLEATEEHLVTDVRIMTQYINNHVKEMISYEHEVTELSEKGQLQEIVAAAPRLHIKAESLLNFDVIDSAISTLASSKFSLVVPAHVPDNSVGELNMNKVDRIYSDPSTERITVPPITLRNVIMQGDTQPIYAVATLRDFVYVIRYRSDAIEVYNSRHMTVVRSISLTAFGADLRAITACLANNCLYVSDYANYCIHRVEMGGLSTVTQWSVVDEPAALSINNVSNVIVTFCAVSRIKEYTPCGKLVRIFNLHPGVLGRPWHCVQVLQSEMYVISHSSPVRGISVIGKNGRLVRTIRVYTDLKGDRTRQMNSPRGLALAVSTGSVLVADYMRVLVLDRTLTHVRELPMSAFRNLKQPYCVCLDESRGRLYVVERSRGRMMVFDLNTVSSVLSDQPSGQRSPANVEPNGSQPVEPTPPDDDR